MRLYRKSLTLLVVAVLAAGMIASSTGAALADGALSLAPHIRSSTTGSTQTFAVMDLVDGESVDISAEVVLSSDVPADAITGTSIKYGQVGTHTLTFTLPASGQSLVETIQVRPRPVVVPPRRLSLVGMTQVAEIDHPYGFSVTVTDGSSAEGTVLTSTGVGDTISGLTVTFGSTGRRTITATLGALTTTTTIPVSTGVIVTGKTTIDGDAVVGSTLVATTTGWAPSTVTLHYFWTRNKEVIPGATGSTYLVTAADEHAKLAAHVGATRPGYYTKGGSVSPRSAKVKDVAKLKLTVPKKLVSGKSGAKKNVVTVSLKPGASKVFARGIVKIHIGSKVLTAKLGKKSTVRITLPKLKKGTYSISATYLGTASYVPTTVLVTRSAK